MAAISLARGYAAHILYVKGIKKWLILCDNIVQTAGDRKMSLHTDTGKQCLESLIYNQTVSAITYLL